MNHRTQNPWIGFGTGALLAAAASASGQSGAGWNIDFIFAPGQTGITPQTPSCTVRLSARFSPNDWAVAGIQWDVLAGEGEWSQNTVLEPLRTASTPGVISGSSVTGIRVGQLFFPPNIFPDTSNPIAAWQATWTARSFTGQHVAFTTRTQRFDVYCRPPRYCGESTFRSALAGLVEGAADLPVAGACYADCDTSTGLWTLDIFDFLCFQNRYVTNDPYACDCDTATGPGLCDIFDFLCFQNAYAAGCP